MCNVTGIVFGVKNLDKDELKGRSVLEVGSGDYNGGLRPILESWGPAQYIGVDIQEGPGVDVVCSAERTVERLGEGRFDIVIATELLEHVRNWRAAITNMKMACKPGGTMLITTRSQGFPYHGYPHDFWRFETDDLKEIFSDCEVLALERDPVDPGVFAKVRKPPSFVEMSLASKELYSIVVDKRVRELAEDDFKSIYFRRLIMRQRFHAFSLGVLSVVLSKIGPRSSANPGGEGKS